MALHLHKYNREKWVKCCCSFAPLVLTLMQKVIPDGLYLCLPDLMDTIMYVVELDQWI